MLTIRNLIHIKECIYSEQIVIIISYLFSSINRDAVSLAQSRLSTNDPVLAKLYTAWAEHLIQENSFEQAAQW